MADDAYPGCKMYVSPSGRAGVVVQNEGNLSGYMWDFFVSHRERARTAYDFVLLAVSEGGNLLATPEHPLLTSFFELFGFQAVSISERTPSRAVHMMLLPDVFKEREPRFRQVLENTNPSDFLESDGQEMNCALCGQSLQAQVFTAEFGGYECPRCKFIRVHGTLTLGRPTNA